MFIATLENDAVINGQNVTWDSMPANAVVKSLACRLVTTRDVVVADHDLSGFDAYGFQRYDVSSADGSVIGSGLQLLGHRYARALDERPVGERKPDRDGQVPDVVDGSDARSGTVTIIDINLATRRTQVTCLPFSQCGYASHLWRRAKGSS